MKYIVVAAVFLLIGALWQMATADPLEETYKQYMHVQMFEDGSYSGETINGKAVSGCVNGGLCED